MLTIYVCDDIAEQAEYHCRIINKFLLFSDWNIASAKSFHSPELLLKELSNSSDMGLYFLDIDFKSDMDGFVLAKRIRELDPRGFIVFLTAYSQHIPLAFAHKVEAMDYIIKEDSEILHKRIKECIHEAYLRYENSSYTLEDTLYLKVDKREIKLNKKHILFFNTSNIPHQINICTTSSLYSVYAKLKDFEPQLGTDFIRIHKSCIINCSYVAEIDYKNHQLIMKNGTKLQSAVRCWKNVCHILKERQNAIYQ